MITLDVAPVCVAVILVFEPTEGVLLWLLRSSVVVGVVEGWIEVVVLHRGLSLHVGPGLLLPISTAAAIVVVVVPVAVVVLEGGALVCCHRCCTLLH